MRYRAVEHFLFLVWSRGAPNGPSAAGFHIFEALSRNNFLNISAAQIHSFPFVYNLWYCQTVPILFPFLLMMDKQDSFFCQSWRYRFFEVKKNDNFPLFALFALFRFAPNWKRLEVIFHTNLFLLWWWCWLIYEKLLK